MATEDYLNSQENKQTYVSKLKEYLDYGTLRFVPMKTQEM
jgi:hypothetical protein